MDELVPEDFDPTPRRISGRIKWFSRPKGYGFIASVKSAEDIFLRREVAIQAGLRNPCLGMRVVCEVAPKTRGLEAIRVLSFEPPRRTLRIGEIAAGVVCEVHWVHVTKGFWYVRCQEFDGDAFLPLSVLQASGFGALPHGARIVCDIECSGGLFQVVRVHTVH